MKKDKKGGTGLDLNDVVVSNVATRASAVGGAKEVERTIEGSA